MTFFLSHTPQYRFITNNASIHNHFSSGSCPRGSRGNNLLTTFSALIYLLRTGEGDRRVSQYISEAYTSLRRRKQHLNGIKENSEGATGVGARPSCKLQRRADGRRPFPLAGNNYGSGGIAVLRWGLLFGYSLPCGLSIQASEGHIHH